MPRTLQISNGATREAEIILLCIRWYLRYALSYRDLEEIIAPFFAFLFRFLQHSLKRCDLDVPATFNDVECFLPLRDHTLM